MSNRTTMLLTLPFVLLAFAACGGDDSSSSGCGNGTKCDGVCRDLATDAMNCGACGDECATGEVCVGGLCNVSCPTGLYECDGACFDLDVDPTNCGECGASCATGEFCVEGGCASSCGSLEDCGGTCRDTQVDPSNCGGCDTACVAGEVCSVGSCELSCQEGLTDCTGSCRDVTTDRANCGACGTACDPGEICVDSACEISCPAGQISCGGACVDPGTDRQYCGASGDCVGANDGTACADGEICDGSGSCELSCQAGLVDCGGTCTNPNTDRAYCGASGDCSAASDGVACAAGQICNGAGVCALSCQAGLIDCGGICTDPNTSLDYCGASADCIGANDGTACLAGQICDGAGVCALSCQAGLVACGGTCIDPASNPTYCGASGDCLGANDGTTCGGGQACSGGACHALDLYLFTGVRTNFPISDLAGWSQCYVGTYDLNVAIPTAACDQANLLLGCRLTGNANLIAAAHAPRADVLFDTGTSNTPHNANSVGWYYNNNYSWGFARLGDVLARSSCDTGATNPGERVCYHTGGGNLNGGWRCGSNTGLNGSVAYERIIFEAP